MANSDPILYSTEGGLAQFKLRDMEGQPWLTQLEMAELYQTSNRYLCSRGNMHGYSAADRHHIRGALHLFLATLAAKTPPSWQKTQWPERAGLQPRIRRRGFRLGR